MNAEIAKIISDNVMAYQPRTIHGRPNHKGLGCYSGVEGVANALGVSCSTAQDLIKDWLNWEWGKPPRELTGIEKVFGVKE